MKEQKEIRLVDPDIKNQDHQKTPQLKETTSMKEAHIQDSGEMINPEAAATTDGEAGLYIL